MFIFPFRAGFAGGLPLTAIFMRARGKDVVMGSNRLPDTLNLLTSLAESAANGAKRHGAAIGLQQNTETAIRADLDALLGTIHIYGTNRAASAKETGKQSTACAEGRTWLLMARDNFKTFLGNRPGKQWVGAGWPDHSIAVPKRAGDIELRLEHVARFLTDNPARGVAAMNLTAARATALAKALLGARGSRNRQKSARVQSKQDRNAAERKLRRRLRGLIEELTQLLDPRAPEWRAFGLRRPGVPDSPAKVKNTRAAALGGGSAQVQCDPAARAEYYQVHMMIVGKDAEFALAESPREPQKIFDSLPVGARVRFKMRAMNETGHGPFGEEVEIVAS